MNHISRERITFDQRISLIRENYGAVSLEGGYITTCSYSWMLTVNVKNAIEAMSLRDFKKMLKVVKHQLDPSDYWMYLGYWKDSLIERSYSVIGDAGRVKFGIRIGKLQRMIRDEEDKMPGYVMEDDDE